MNVEKMTKKQLIAELTELRERIEELEAAQKRRKGTEEALRESEGRYRVLAETARDFIYLITPDMRLEYINAAGARQYKACPEDIIGKPLNEIFHPETYERQQRNIRKVFQTGEPVNAEHSYEFPTSDFWLSICLVPVTNESGEITHVLGISRDITERKRIEKALRESEERYRLLAENVTDIIWTMDMNLRYTYISPSVTQAEGYTVEEAMSRSLEEIMTPASLEFVRRVYEEEMAIERQQQNDLHRSRTLEVELKCKDGSTYWAELKVTFLRDEEGKPVGILGVTRHIDARKRAEEALQESKERLSVFMESALDAFALFDSEMNLVEINKAGLRFFGADVRKEDVVGKNIRELSPGVKEAEKYDKYMEVVKTGKALSFDAIVAHQQSGNLHLTVKLFKVIDGLGMIVTDITEHKEFDRLIAEAHEEERHRLSSELHDNVGQLLTAVKMRIDRLRDTRYDNIAALTTELSEVSHVLGDVLQKTRDLSHRLRPPLLDQLGLVAAVRSLANQFRLSTGAVVLVDAAPGSSEQLPKHIELLIYRVVQEALTNIARHAAASEVHVRLSTADGRFELSVQDDGKGFDVASQANRTGCVGLRSMQERVTSSGGTFRLDALPEKGTALCVTLPVAEA